MWWLLVLPLVAGQCPWSRELVDLHTDCVCAYSNGERLSIQCSPVNFTKLLDTLRVSVRGLPIDLLYVSNASIDVLRDKTFEELKIQSLQLSRSRIREVEPDAFAGLESGLVGLDLQDNLLEEVPVQALGKLRSLQLLDLSRNRIVRIADEAFAGVRQLGTLKLSDNRLDAMSDRAFAGLEGSLKNLNLQACEMKDVPDAVKRLRTLAFLDLAQNRIEKLQPGFLSDMQSLTALNLERNKIKSVEPGAFEGVGDTLSSLSLLNNLLEEFPSEAVAALPEIRVLDLGFNKIKMIPVTAFENNKYLTLLALDGNPMSTLPREAFTQLNSTLRGLSLGGASLHCDCRIQWIAEWVRDKELQVTSRERNPQFCGYPEHLRRRTFSELLPSDLVCEKQPKRLDIQIVTVDTQVDVEPEPKKGDAVQSRKEGDLGIRIRQAYKRDSTLILEWESPVPSLRGYQVLIRLFGSRDLKRIVPLPPEKRRLQMEHLPLGRCLVACVIEFQDASTIRVEDIPPSQCRELRGDENRLPSLDKVVIAASAIVCVLVVVGAIVAVVFLRRRPPPNASLVVPPLSKQPTPETDWETLSWNSSKVFDKGFCRSYSTQDNGLYLPPKISSNNLDLQRSKSLTRGNPHKKKKQHRPNGRQASASSSTECESDWNGKSIWKDNDVDIYVSQNHARKYRNEYAIR